MRFSYPLPAQRMMILVSFALFIALLLVACGGGGGAAEEEAGPQSASIEVSQNDNYFGDTPDNADNPPTWTVPSGAQVTVALTNNGTLEHNWAIVQMGEEVPEPFNVDEDSGILLDQTGLVTAGSTFNDVFVAPAAGTYTVICTVAGHYPGMQGQLVVTE